MKFTIFASFVRLVYASYARRWHETFVSIMAWFVGRTGDGLIEVSLFDGGKCTSRFAHPSCPFMDMLMGRRVVATGNVSLAWLVPSIGGDDNDTSVCTVAYTIRRKGRISTVYSHEKDINVEALFASLISKDCDNIIEIVLTGNVCVDVSDVVGRGWMDSDPPCLHDILHIALDVKKIALWDVPNVRGVRITGFNKDFVLVERTFDVGHFGNARLCID